ncbi:hypothetical protein, partial [Acinetobacter sp. ANC 4193]
TNLSKNSIALTKPLFLNKFLSTSPPMDTHYRPFIIACKYFLALFISGVRFFSFLRLFDAFIRFFS